MFLRTATRVAVALAAAMALTTGAVSASPASPPPRPEGERLAQHVVMFDFDGFDPRLLYGEYADLAELPNIRALIENGAYGVARGSFSSYSNSSRATNATGTYPDVHRNTAYYFDAASGRAVGQERYIEPGVETIAQALRRQDRTAAYLQWYIVENYGAAYGDPASLYTQPGGTCDRRADQAVSLMRGEPVDSRGTMVDLEQIPDLITVYCSEIDSLIHDGGFEHPDLPAALEHVDAQVGKVVEAAREAGILDETTFVMTADHGMREWTRPLLPEVLDVLAGTGFRAEAVPTGGVPDPATEIAIVATPRVADVVLHGAAATPHNQRRIARAIEQIHGIAAVYDEHDLRRIRASDKFGDLVIEPTEPYHLSTNTDGVMRASHGGVPEARVPLVLSGAAIRDGVQLHGVGLVDVAPTITALLGVQAPSSAEGKVPWRAIDQPSA